MAHTIEAKELKYKELPGLSADLLAQHHGLLYKGYVNKTNEIRKGLETVDYSTANQTYSALREYKLEESFALNGVKLHEAYFDNLGGDGGKATGKALSLLERDFGSYEAWEKDFTSSGVAARGWVVLAYDLDDGRLHNYLCDAHNQGGIWSAIPLLVLDTYEHAYGLDYGVKRPPYIETFMKNIDWSVVNERLAKLNV